MKPSARKMVANCGKTTVCSQQLWQDFQPEQPLLSNGHQIQPHLDETLPESVSSRAKLLQTANNNNNNKHLERGTDFGKSGVASSKSKAIVIQLAKLILVVAALSVYNQLTVNYQIDQVSLRAAGRLVVVVVVVYLSPS